MLVAPDVKWPNGHYIGDLANIYMQGGAGQRALPGLADALRFWGYWDDEHRPLPEDIETAYVMIRWGLLQPSSYISRTCTTCSACTLGAIPAKSP
jgi:hypothetical protein